MGKNPGLPVICSEWACCDWALRRCHGSPDEPGGGRRRYGRAAPRTQPARAGFTRWRVSFSANRQPLRRTRADANARGQAAGVATVR